MKKIRQWIRSFRPYRYSMNDIIYFRILCTAVSSLFLVILGQLGLFLIRSTGRVAISTGDFDFLFKSWQGPLLIIVGLSVLFLYVVFDLNTQIIYSSKLLHNQASLIESLKEGLLSITKFFTLDGIGIILYISLIAPIAGLGLSISLTENLYIPTFISSVIESKPLYHALYTILIVLFFLFGLIHIFILHGILLGRLPVNKADDESRDLMKKNWKDFIKQNTIFILSFAAVNIFLFLLVLIIPGAVLVHLSKDLQELKINAYFVLLLYAIAFLFVNSFFQSFYLIRMTQLYYEYKGERLPFIREMKGRRWIFNLLIISAVIALTYFSAFEIERNFDKVFPREVTTSIIAHRGGGNEAVENTVEGIEKAIELGAAGSEIDIQRTKDGYYIVNHDSTFSRLCKNPNKPSDLTLDEIKGIVIHDPNYPNDPQDIATFEEILDAAKGKITLFIELKGDSADQKMVDDAIRLIREKDMTDQCVLISLKYSLIDYAEKTYPGIQTGYLTFASFGKTENISCDYLGLEEEAATSAVISRIHDSGRKVMVWTPNEDRAQRHFLLSQADYIITDNIQQAIDLTKELNEREDLIVFLDFLLSLF